MRRRLHLAPFPPMTDRYMIPPSEKETAAADRLMTAAQDGKISGEDLQTIFDARWRTWPEIDVKRLRLEPGDVLVIRCDIEPNVSWAEELERQVHAIIDVEGRPPVPVMITGPDLSLLVLTPPKSEGV